MTRPGNPAIWAASCITLALGVLLLLWIARPRLIVDGVAANDMSAIAALRRYATVQSRFADEARYSGVALQVYANPVHGSGFPDLARFGKEEQRTALGALPRDVAGATAPHTARHGYFFVDIVGNRKGLYDFSKDCGLCAVPAEWNVTGRGTYIINVAGTVYRKDNGGRPVTIWPDVEKEGWLPVGSE